MNCMEKLQDMFQRGSLEQVNVNINILKPSKDNKMVVTKSNVVTTGSLEIKDFKFYLTVPKANYKGYVAIEYIDFDMIELIDVTKLPRKLLVFDVELPVPF